MTTDCDGSQRCGCSIRALAAIHSTLSTTVRTAIALQKTSEDLLAEIERDQAQLTETNAQLADPIEQLTQQATHDALTGLLNRRGMFEALESLIGERRHAAGRRAVLGPRPLQGDQRHVGHRGGDHFLRIVADRIERCITSNGVAGRIGGDEFVVALPGRQRTGDGRRCPPAAWCARSGNSRRGTRAAVLRQHRNRPRPDPRCQRERSLGERQRRALSGEDVRSQQGHPLRHRPVRENRDRIDLELRLRRAIDDGDIVPFFQPELDASTGMIVGAELLARWVQPNGSVVAAHDFMDLAVRAGLLDRVTERVFGGARRQIRRLAVLGLPEGFRFRVNLAPHSTERPWRDNPIDLLVAGIDPHLLTVDVRESFVNVDLPSAASNLAEFRARGGRVCLDDFAQGVSSLSMLRRLPLDEVRIDRISIDTITTHPHDRAIVRSIIALTREIGLEVTADGVETGAQADALIALGCVRQQGHLYAPALPEEAFENYLLRRLAEQYVQAADTRPTWNTHELAD